MNTEPKTKMFRFGRPSIFLLVSLCLASGNLLCGAAKEKTQEQEVEQFIRHYFRSWSDQDMDAYGKCFLPNASIQFIDPQGRLTNNSREKFLTSQRDYHRRAPYRAKEIPVSIDIRFEAKLARAVVFWKLTAGSRRESGYDHFTLIEQKGKWWIANLIFYSAPRDTQASLEPAPNRDKILAQMADVIAPSIQRRDTSHPIFHGCIDWHSAVHGHWALLRIARVTGKHQELAEKVAAAFIPGRVQQEAALLRQRKNFEMPYGRAWFLRLVVEYELWSRERERGDANELKTMGDEISASIMDYYSDGRDPTPVSREYDNDSWALVQLHAYFEHRSDETGLQTVTKLIEKHFLESQAPVRFSLDRQRSDFFSAFGNWAYLIARTQDANTLERFLQTHPITDEELVAVGSLTPRDHHLGVNWSRAWALRALSRQAKNQQDRQRFNDAFLKHLETGMKHHRQNVGNFRAYDHWVPQFAVYAITE